MYSKGGLKMVKTMKRPGNLQEGRRKDWTDNDRYRLVKRPLYSAVSIIIVKFGMIVRSKLSS